MLEGARLSNVKEYMYTSTYGVYSNKGEMIEDKMWENNPSDNDIGLFIIIELSLSFKSFVEVANTVLNE